MGISRVRFALVSSLVGLTLCNTSPAVSIPAVTGGYAKDPVAKAWINKGVVKLVAGNLSEARSCFDAAIKVEPSGWSAYHNRGVVSYLERKWASAVSDFSTSLRFHPKFVRTAVLRAYANARLGNCRESLAELNHITSKIRLRDDTEAMVLNHRARLRLFCHDTSIHNPQAALADAKIACKLTRFRDNDYIDTLAQAYAENGDFDSAVKHERKAIEVVNKRKTEVTTDIPKTLKYLEEQITTFQQHRVPSD